MRSITNIKFYHAFFFIILLFFSTCSVFNPVPKIEVEFSELKENKQYSVSHVAHAVFSYSVPKNDDIILNLYDKNEQLIITLFNFQTNKEIVKKIFSLETELMKHKLSLEEKHYQLIVIGKHGFAKCQFINPFISEN